MHGRIIYCVLLLDYVYLGKNKFLWFEMCFWKIILVTIIIFFLNSYNMSELHFLVPFIPEYWGLLFSPCGVACQAVIS